MFVNPDVKKMTYAEATSSSDKVQVSFLPQRHNGKEVTISLAEILRNESNSKRFQAMQNMPDPMFIGVLSILGQAQVVKHTPHLLGPIEPLRQFDLAVTVYFTPDPLSGDEVNFKRVFRDRSTIPVQMAALTTINQPSTSVYLNDEQGWMISCPSDRGLPILFDLTNVCSAVVNVEYRCFASGHAATFKRTHQIRIGQMSESVSYQGYVGSGLRSHENIARQRAALHCKWPTHVHFVTYESAIPTRETASRSRQWDEAMNFLAQPEGTLWPYGHIPYQAMLKHLPDEQFWQERVKLLYPEGQYDEAWLPAVATLISVAPVLTLKDVQEFIACCKLENIFKMSPHNIAKKFHYHPATAEYCMNALSTYTAEAFQDPAALLRLRFVQAKRHDDQLCSRVVLELERSNPSIISAVDKLFYPSQVASRASGAATTTVCTTCKSASTPCNCRLAGMLPRVEPNHPNQVLDQNMNAEKYSHSTNPSMAVLSAPVQHTPMSVDSTDLQAHLNWPAPSAHNGSNPASAVPTASHQTRLGLSMAEIQANLASRANDAEQLSQKSGQAVPLAPVHSPPEMTEFQANLMVRQRKRAHQNESNPAGASHLSLLDPEDPTRMKLIKLANDRMDENPLSAIPPRVYDPPVIPAQFPAQMETCEPSVDPIVDKTKRLYPDIHQFMYPDTPQHDQPLFLHDMKRVRTWLDNQMTVWYKPIPGILVRNENDSRTSMQFVFRHMRLIAYLLNKEWLKHLLMELPEMTYPPAKVKIQVQEKDLHDLIWPHLNQTFIRVIKVALYHSPYDEQHEDPDYPSHLDHLHVVISQIENSEVEVSFGYKRRKFLSASTAFWASKIPPPGPNPDDAPTPGCTTSPILQRTHALSHMSESDRQKFEAYVEDLAMDQDNPHAEKALQALKQQASICRNNAYLVASTYSASLGALDLSNQAPSMVTQ